MLSLTRQIWIGALGAALGVVMLAIPGATLDWPGPLPLWAGLGGFLGATAATIFAYPFAGASDS